jgi:hypothetical protein
MQSPMHRRIEAEEYWYIIIIIIIIDAFEHIKSRPRSLSNPSHRILSSFILHTPPQTNNLKQQKCVAGLSILASETSSPSFRRNIPL